MDVSLTRVSSKGQVVIPVEMRDEFNEGDKLIIIRDGGRLVLKKVDELSEDLKDDLEFAKRTEEAWKRYDKGLFIETSEEEFLELLNKW